MYLKLSFFLAFILIELNSNSQNTSSPYSILGIGDIETSYFNRTSGMANTGIAYRNMNYITNNNPASLSVLYPQLFFVDIASRGRFVNYSGKTITNANNSSQDFSVERLSVGMRIKKWWGSSVGISPFSTSNYAFSGSKPLVGTNSSLPAEYEGTGGVNQFNISNGFTILRNLSVGINTSLLWGSLTQKESLTSSDLSTSLYTTRNIFLRNWYLNYGAQYAIPVTKKWNVIIGGTYAPSTSLYAEYNLSVINDKDTLKDEIVKNDYFKLPNSTGIGIALIKNNDLTFVADYRVQQWASLKYKGANYSLENSERFSVGFDYSKQNKYKELVFERYNLQAGIFYNNSYLKIYNEQIKDRGITFGMGINSKRTTLSYHVALEYGVKGSHNQSIIQEKYTNLTIGLSYKDFWYTRGKKYD